jgi:hypothetical protein
MASAASQPNLRLVGADDAADTQWRVREQARLAVIKENRLASASGLDAHDPRLALAIQARERLQGAMLTPEHRDQLLKTGQKLGLRSFESNLVIAIVQDQARQGKESDAKLPALKLISETPVDGFIRQAESRGATWPQWFAAIAAAMAVAGLLIRWIVAP